MSIFKDNPPHQRRYGFFWKCRSEAFRLQVTNIFRTLKAAFHRKRKKRQETERHRTQVSSTLDTRCVPARQEENTRL